MSHHVVIQTHLHVATGAGAAVLLALVIGRSRSSATVHTTIPFTTSGTGDLGQHQIVRYTHHLFSIKAAKVCASAETKSA